MWDSSPRTVQSDAFDNLGYSFMYTLKNNTPENFRTALEMAKQRIEKSGIPHPFLTINAWSEGSYLEPDEINGMGYLEAIEVSRLKFEAISRCL